MRRAPLKKNPLKNVQVMLRLNPYTQTFRRQQALLEMKNQISKEGEKWFNVMYFQIFDHSVTCIFSVWIWVS